MLPGFLEQESQFSASSQSSSLPHPHICNTSSDIYSFDKNIKTGKSLERGMEERKKNE